jgi:acetyl-CoA synthetase
MKPDLGQYKDYQDVTVRFRWEIPENYNIALDTVDKWGDHKGRVALFYEDDAGNRKTYTFWEMRNDSNRCANLLKDLGIRKADRVGIVLPQQPEAAMAHLGNFKIGAVGVPLSTLYGPDAIEYRLKDSGAKAVIVGQKYKDRVLKIRHNLKSLEYVIVVGEADSDEIDFHKELACKSTEFEVENPSSRDPCLILYTSGTTGPPKGVYHAHRILAGYLLTVSLMFNVDFDQGSVFWTPSEWAYVGGLLDLLLPAWSLGYPVVGYNGRFSPDKAFELADRYGITHIFIVPSGLRMMAQVPNIKERYDLDIRVVASGGEAVGSDVIRWAGEELGAVVNEFYGLTEVNHLIGNCAKLWPAKVGSMGLPFPGREVDLIDSEGKSVPPGEEGQIVVKKGDPTMFLGYWNQPEKTLDRFQGDWILTGDMAERDKDGYYWFHGREDDLIKSSGYRIGPFEVEQCLLKLPCVSEAAVVASPDKTRGHIVKAFIMLAKGYAATEELKKEIQTHVKESLAAYQYPREIEFVEEFPLTATGKINRRILRMQEEEKKKGRG